MCSLVKSMLCMLLVWFIFRCFSQSVNWHGISAVWSLSSVSLVWFDLVLTLASIFISVVFVLIFIRSFASISFSSVGMSSS